MQMTSDPSMPIEAAGPPATSLRRALGILGDPWTMLIIKESFNGVRRFGDFQRNLNIPKQTLSVRLNDLCAAGMLYRRYLNARAGTISYHPTPKTFDLHQAMYAVWLWHRANPGEIDVLPFDLVHTDCGSVLDARYCCLQCGDPVPSASMKVERTRPDQRDLEHRPRLSRRNDSAFTAAQGEASGLIAASLVGDIPCNEILYTLFQGPQNLMGLARELQIGHLVLRDRLNRLLALGMIGEEKEGRQSIFSPLPRAEQFYPLILSIAAWGDRWCNGENPPPEIRVHSCGNLLDGHYRCNHCDGRINRMNIRISPHGAPP